MIGSMRWGSLGIAIALAGWHADAFGQCAPAPDSPYFFRNLTELRAAAKISGDRDFFENLLSETFEKRATDGRVVPKHAFIESEFASNQISSRKRFFVVRNFSLVEHRKGFVVASYLLTEGTTGGGETHATEHWFRDVYQVEVGKWRLAQVEAAQPATAHQSR
jgi:hypothetical protein